MCWPQELPSQWASLKLKGFPWTVRETPGRQNVSGFELYWWRQNQWRRWQPTNDKQLGEYIAICQGRLNCRVLQELCNRSRRGSWHIRCYITPCLSWICCQLYAKNLVSVKEDPSNNRFVYFGSSWILFSCPQQLNRWPCPSVWPN